MRRRAVRGITVISLAFSLSLFFGAGCLRADNSPEADRDWQVILQQASGPGNRFRTQEEALAIAREHLDKQEAALREFEHSYPSDSRHYSAVIRLATILAAKARLRHEPVLMDNARQLLGDLEKDAKTPLPVKADAGFARVSQSMQDMSGGHADATARETLLQTVRQFDTAYPTDRRTPNLLTELATLYDDQPAQKQALLEEAFGRTTDAVARRRVSDDLKRLGLLGKPLELRIEPYTGGAAIEMAQRRGRVQVILFWASYSMPALHELAVLKKVAAQAAAQAVDFVTISVDEDRNALTETLKAADVKWPTHCDGKGWTGETVRDLGINALPVVWVLDRKGVLTNLNARGTEAESIRQALAQP